MPKDNRGWIKTFPRRMRLQSISLPFVIILIFSLSIITAYALIADFLQGDKIDFFNQKLGIVSNYLRIVDRQSATLVRNIDTLIKDYQSNKNIFKDDDVIIEEVWTQIVNQFETLVANNPQYARMASFLKDTYPHREELMQYMGKNVAKNYLVILQNSAESRPNGGFFGSFAYVRVSRGKLIKMIFIDSYLGYKTMPWVQLLPPAWSAPIYNNVPYGRIAANKFGFTNIDGDHLVQLYNKTFNSPDSRDALPSEICNDMCGKEIDGIIFVQTDILEQLIPDLIHKNREREFVNASIDLIRGEDLPNKKEFYLSDAQDFFIQHSNIAIQNFINQFAQLTDQYSFGIYIPQISSSLNTILSDYHFTTLPRNDTIYSRDTNRTMNKSSKFVNKKLTIRNNLGDSVIEQFNNDQINISTLDPGNYTLTISYSLNVPDSYVNFITSLEDKYNIQLTDRELGILVLQPIVDDAGIARLRESKSQIYYPNTLSITSITGDYQHTYFETPFGKGLDYIVSTDTNATTKEIILQFSKQ